jgi:uncharacterized protein
MQKHIAVDVDSYIANASIVSQSTLRDVRKIIQSTIPEAVESISWGVPFYRYYGPLAGFALYKNHVSFGITSLITDELRNQLEKNGYKTGKKTIQIKFDQQVPSTIIKQILTAQAKNNQIITVRK